MAQCANSTLSVIDKLKYVQSSKNVMLKVCFALSVKIITKVSDLGRGGLKAQQAHSPGQAKRHPGLRIAIVLTPCKGKSVINMAQSLSKISIRMNASALTGRTNDNTIIPRVSLRLPWAMRSLGFQPVLELNPKL